jgi:hypothetical protein
VDAEFAVITSYGVPATMAYRAVTRLTANLGGPAELCNGSTTGPSRQNFTGVKIMDVIQVGVNVAGSRKKNHLCQCPWQGHGPRPVPVRCTKCMRVRVVSRRSFNFIVLLDHNTRFAPTTRNLPRRYGLLLLLPSVHRIFFEFPVRFTCIRFSFVPPRP